MIKVIIADDHKIFLEGLASLLRSSENIELMGQADNGQAAVELIRDKQPDIAVLDISMPVMSGLESLETIVGEGLPVRVILLTLHKETEKAIHAVKAGTMGYVLKENTFDELLTAIKTVYSGERYISPSIAGAIVGVDLSQDRKTDVLTPREKEVLVLIAKGLTNKQIAKQLFISIKTVDTHRARLMRKLDIHTVASLVRYAVKEGLVVD